MNLLKDLQLITNNTTTYKVGLLQTKAYRVLKIFTEKHLEPFHLSSLEWAFIGILFEEKEGLQFSEVASVLGVEKPMITEMVEKLSKKNLITITTHKDDKRMKIIQLSKKGVETVKEVEPIMRSASKELLKGVSFKEVVSYLKVLHTIIEHSE